MKIVFIIIMKSSINNTSKIYNDIAVIFGNTTVNKFESLILKLLKN